MRGTCTLWGRFSRQQHHRPGRAQPAYRRRLHRVPQGGYAPGANRLGGVGPGWGPNPRFPTSPARPLTRVKARHSDPSRHSARPVPGRLPIPAHGPSRGTAAPRAEPCTGVPSLTSPGLPRAAPGPEVRPTRTASAPRRVPNLGEVAPSVAGPSLGLVGFLGVATGTGSSESGLTPCPSSAPFTHARGPRVRRDRGPDTPPSLGPLRGARPGSGLMNDPGRTRIHVPQSPRAAPLPRPSSDRASGTPAL
jgi:hypothetical protein